MKLLLHCCCGPCTSVVVDHFRSLGAQVTGWFFNPNIHPAEELRRRQATFEQTAQVIGLPVHRPAGSVAADVGAPALPEAEEGLRGFLLALASQGGKRCRACYGLRLEAAAAAARSEGFDSFSTTLLISPHQEVEAIGELGAAIGARLGVKFGFADLRGRYAESCERARELDLYRQNYCGCLFSLLERSERRAGRAIERARKAMAAQR